MEHLTTPQSPGSMVSRHRYNRTPERKRKRGLRLYEDTSTQAHQHQLVRRDNHGYDDHPRYQPPAPTANDPTPTIVQEPRKIGRCLFVTLLFAGALIAATALLKGFEGTVTIESPVYFNYPLLKLTVTPTKPHNKDEHVVQKPAQQRTIKDFLLDDIHALNEDCSSIDTLVTTILYKLPVLFGDAVHTLDRNVEQRLVQECTLKHTKRFTSNGLTICNGDNGNPLGYLIQCVYPDYYPRIGESPPTRTR